MFRPKVSYFYVGPAIPGAAVPVREVSRAEWDAGEGCDRDGLDVEVRSMPDGSFRLRTDTWYQGGGFAELALNAVDLPGAIRCFWAMSEQADREQ